MIHFFNGYVYVYMPTHTHTHTQANQHIFTQTHVSFPLFSSIKKKKHKKDKTTYNTVLITIVLASTVDFPLPFFS
jgi:hypothetical protein